MNLCFPDSESFLGVDDIQSFLQLLAHINTVRDLPHCPSIITDPGEYSGGSENDRKYKLITSTGSASSKLFVKPLPPSGYKVLYLHRT